MDKEEILEKSRQENKNKDLYEKEVLKKASWVCTIVVLVFCISFTIFEVCIESNSFYAFESILCAMCASQFIYKSIKLRNRHEIVLSVIYSVLTILFTTLYIIKQLGI